MSWAALMTRSRVVLEIRMPGELFRTTETVDCEHAARRATSVMVTRFDPGPPPLRLRFPVAGRPLSGSSARLLSILSPIRPASRFCFGPPAVGRGGGNLNRHLPRNTVAIGGRGP